MAPIPATSPQGRRRTDDWRRELGLVIEGEATIVARSPGTARPAPADARPTSEPRWGAALHAANTNTRPPARARKPRSAGLWASLGLQTGAALAGLAVLGFIVFPPAETRPAAAPAPASVTLPVAGAAR